MSRDPTPRCQKFVLLHYYSCRQHLSGRYSYYLLRSRSLCCVLPVPLRQLSLRPIENIFRIALPVHPFLLLHPFTRMVVDLFHILLKHSLILIITYIVIVRVFTFLCCALVPVFCFLAFNSQSATLSIDVNPVTEQYRKWSPKEPSCKTSLTLIIPELIK